MKHITIHLIAATSFLYVMSCARDVVACAIDPAFSAPQRHEVELAADDWNSITTKPIVLADDGDWVMYLADLPPGYAGWTDAPRHTIRIDPNLPINDMRRISRHELGHALGLRHTSHGVMNGAGAEDAFSREDIAECVKRDACDE